MNNKIDETFLKTQKNCLAEYVGSELSLKRGKTCLRADVFGVSNQDEQIIYLCGGEKGLKYRNLNQKHSLIFSFSIGFLFMRSISDKTFLKNFKEKVLGKKTDTIKLI
jgi:hypothetical protein